MELVEGDYIRSVWTRKQMEKSLPCYRHIFVLWVLAKGVFVNIAMPEADTNPDFKSWSGTDKITKKENGKQQNRITKTEKRITNKENRKMKFTEKENRKQLINREKKQRKKELKKRKRKKE